MEAPKLSIFLGYLSVFASLSVGVMLLIASTQLTSSKYSQENMQSMQMGWFMVISSIITFLIMILNRSKSVGWVYLVLTLNTIFLISSSVIGGNVVRAVQCDKDSDAKINTAYNMSLYSSWIGLIVGFLVSIIQGFVQREKLSKALQSVVKCPPCPDCIPDPPSHF